MRGEDCRGNAGKGGLHGRSAASPEAGIIFDGTRVLASALQQNDQLANGHQGQRTSSMSQHHQQQMTFAQIGTLYNTISNELEGGVTHQNQALLVSQVTTVQTQMQNLIKSGALNSIDEGGN